MALPKKLMTLIIKSPGTKDKGKLVPGPEVTTTIRASLQPMKGSELQSLPENRRFKEVQKLYSFQEIPLADDTNPPIVVVNGVRYEVFMKAPWQNNIINHYKYFVAKCNDPAN